MWDYVRCTYFVIQLAYTLYIAGAYTNMRAHMANSTMHRAYIALYRFNASTLVYVYICTHSLTLSLQTRQTLMVHKHTFQGCTHLVFVCLLQVKCTHQVEALGACSYNYSPQAAGTSS